MKPEKKYIKDFDLDEYLVLKEKADAVDKNMVWHSFKEVWVGADLTKIHSVDETLIKITKDYKDKIKELEDGNLTLMLENSLLKKEIESNSILPKQPKNTRLAKLKLIFKIIWSLPFNMPFQIK